MRTNDVVVVSFVEALLSDAGIGHLVLDGHMSVLEGSIGAVPRRVLVERARAEEARRLAVDAGLAAHLR